MFRQLRRFPQAWPSRITSGLPTIRELAMVLLSRPRGRAAHSLISVMIEPNKAIGEA